MTTQLRKSGSNMPFACARNACFAVRIGLCGFCTSSSPENHMPAKSKQQQKAAGAALAAKRGAIPKSRLKALPVRWWNP